MPLSPNKQDRILLLVAIAAAALVHVSIAASQILLGLGALLLLFFTGNGNFRAFGCRWRRFFFGPFSRTRFPRIHG